MTCGCVGYGESLLLSAHGFNEYLHFHSVEDESKPVKCVIKYLEYQVWNVATKINTP